MTPAPALDLTTSLRGDFVVTAKIAFFFTPRWMSPLKRFFHGLCPLFFLVKVRVVHGNAMVQKKS